MPDHRRSQRESIFESEAALQVVMRLAVEAQKVDDLDDARAFFDRCVAELTRAIRARDGAWWSFDGQTPRPETGRVLPDEVLDRVCSLPSDCCVSAAFAGHDPLDLHQLLDVICDDETAYLFVSVKYLAEPQLVMAFEIADVTLGQRTAWVHDGTSTLGQLADVVHALIERLHRAGSEVTDRLDTEEALRESETRFRQAFEGANSGICLLSIDRKLLEVNDSLARFWGYPPGELVGRAIATMHHPDDDSDGPDQLDLIVRGDLSSATFSRKYVRSDGTAVTADVSVSLVSDRRHRPLYFIVHITDTTQRRALEERLRQGEKMEAIGQLAGGIAHDVNNQLGGILGYAELLARKLDDPTTKGYCDAIIRSAMRTADFTAQLLSFARPEGATSVRLDLHELIEEVAELLRRSVGPTITIVTTLGAGRSTLMTDPSQLQSALLNLGLNARDAMPRGGRVEFRTSTPSETHVELEVSDTGTGMTAEVKRRLFEPFFTTKEKGKGTGLGLASVYATVTNHGGSITVDSAEGEGTTFRILLPLADNAD